MVKITYLLITALLVLVFYIVLVRRGSKSFHNCAQENWSLKVAENTTSIAFVL